MNISDQLGSNIEVDKYLPQTFFHATTRKGNALGIHKNWFNSDKVHQSGATFFTQNPRFANTYIGFDSANPERKEKAIQSLMAGKTQPSVFPVNIEKGKFFDPYNSDHLKDIYQELPKFIKSDDNIHGHKTVSSVIDKLKDKSEESWHILENRDVSTAIKNAGYDGSHVREHGFENLAIFDSRKAKSVFETGIGIAIETTGSAASKVQKTGIGNLTSKFANIMKNTLRNLS